MNPWVKRAALVGGITLAFLMYASCDVPPPVRGMVERKRDGLLYVNGGGDREGWVEVDSDASERCEPGEHYPECGQ